MHSVVCFVLAKEFHNIVLMIRSAIRLIDTPIGTHFNTVCKVITTLIRVELLKNSLFLFSSIVLNQKMMNGFFVENNYM